jgi:hypothetical protein
MDKKNKKNHEKLMQTKRQRSASAFGFEKNKIGGEHSVRCTSAPVGGSNRKFDGANNTDKPRGIITVRPHKRAFDEAEDKEDAEWLPPKRAKSTAKRAKRNAEASDDEAEEDKEDDDEWQSAKRAESTAKRAKRNKADEVEEEASDDAEASDEAEYETKKRTKKGMTPAQRQRKTRDKKGAGGLSNLLRAYELAMHILLTAQQVILHAKSVGDTSDPLQDLNEALGYGPELLGSIVGARHPLINPNIKNISDSQRDRFLEIFGAVKRNENSIEKQATHIREDFMAQRLALSLSSFQEYEYQRLKEEKKREQEAEAERKRLKEQRLPVGKWTDALTAVHKVGPEAPSTPHLVLPVVGAMPTPYVSPIRDGGPAAVNPGEEFMFMDPI